MIHTSLSHTFMICLRRCLTSSMSSLLTLIPEGSSMLCASRSLLTCIYVVYVCMYACMNVCVNVYIYDTWRIKHAVRITIPTNLYLCCVFMLCMYVCMYACMYVCMRERLHIWCLKDSMLCTSRSLLTCIYFEYVCMCVWTYTYINIHRRTYIYMYMVHVCVYEYTCSCAWTYMTLLKDFIYVYIYMYIYIYIYILYMHTQTHTLSQTYIPASTKRARGCFRDEAMSQ